MLSNKPYLLRAFYEWIVDSKCTPLLVVNASFPKVSVPADFIQNGEITLNVSPDAVRDFKISNKAVEFRASFSGIVHIITSPVNAVTAVYAQENGQGMFFDAEEFDDAATMEDELVTEEAGSKSSDSSAGTKTGASHLRIIK